MKLIHLTAALALGILVPGVSQAASICPVFTAQGASNSDCNIQINIGSGGSLSIIPGASISPTYDGSDDVVVGVTNNSGAAVNSINLSSTLDIFGFDDDGIDTFAPSGSPITNPQDSSGYGGPDVFFSNINAGATAGTVNFIGGLANGASTYFSLEEAVTASQITPTPSVPEPGTLLMMGTGIVGFAGMLRRKLSK